MQIIGAIIFILGYLGIATEHTIKTSKSAIALAMGGSLWLLASLVDQAHVRDKALHAGAEIFEIVAFLLAAMSLVEILVHYRFFDIVRGKLFSLGLDDKKQFLILSFITFFLSAAIDNLTTTIVMIQIARQFFKGKNLLVVAAGIVILANAGGAWSPIGDVTTIMLWIAQKFSAFEIISRGILPSLVIGIIAAAMLYFKVETESTKDEEKDVVLKLSKSEMVIVGLTFASFTLPVIMNAVFNLPPYLGLLIGLGIVWGAVDVFKQIRPKETHLEANIERLLQKTDIASIKFFIGILLAVSALGALGILDQLSLAVYGAQPEILRMITGNILLGFVSAILDNVPLAAITLEILKTTNTSLWVLLAITLGTGGSMLVIGSAAGVVAMGMIKELTFSQYLKIASIPALVSFAAGVGVWAIQYFVFGF